MLLSFFKHPDGFAKENVLCDDATDGCEIFSSIQAAQKSLSSKIQR